MIVSVLRAGAGYVPIDQSWPLERVRHILRGTGATIILCSSATTQEYADLPQKAVIIAEGHFGETVVAETAPLATPLSLALIIYTRRAQEV